MKHGDGSFGTPEAIKIIDTIYDRRAKRTVPVAHMAQNPTGTPWGFSGDKINIIEI